jgi:N-acyl homoserine lactone hydrolase
MVMGWRAAIFNLVVGVALVAAPLCKATELPPKPVVRTTRLYVLDCGTITNIYPEIFGLTREEVKNTTLAVMCFLIVNPKGTLLWDTGLPDRWVGRPIYENPSIKGVAGLKMNTLIGQLADIGYSPDMIDYLSLSHSHYDHSGNANTYAKSTWLVSKAEWDYMFGEPAGTPPRGYDDFALLKTAKTKFVPDNYDVFGDGTVLIKQAFGHTPGHSVLQVNLKSTGTVILAGDLFHYTEELTLDRMSDRERKSGTPESRAKIQALAKETNGQIWIAHELDLFRRLHHEPAYYE